jgi:prepilin-type N-terminal cleavage/methylation domain-containing protein
MKRSDSKNRFGFTLIEALVATTIIGIAIVALMTANVSHTKVNAFGINTSTAEFLVEEIRALTASLDVVDPNTGTATFGPESGESTVANYDDLDDFYASPLKSFNPPINALGAELTDFPEYTQVIAVENVGANDFTTAIANHGSSIVRVSVQIMMNSEEITSSSWIRVKH